MDIPAESLVILKPRPPWWRRWLKRLGKAVLLLAIAIGCRQAWHHHQASKHLAETLAEIDRAEPGWHLEDIEAAREQVPEEENSARVVVAVAKLLPKDWPPQEFDDLFGNLAPEEQLVPAAFTRLKRELDAVRPALGEAHKLVGMPRGRHHIVYQRLVHETLLPDQAESRRVMWLLLLDAMRHDHEGSANAALVSCRAALNAARSLGDEPFATSQFIRIACVLNTCQALERALAQGEPPSADLVAMQQALNGEDAFPDFFLAARGERAALHATYEALESGDVPLSKLEGSGPKWTDHLYGWFSREKIREAHPVMLAQMSRWLTIAQLPLYQQAAPERALDVKLRGLQEVDPLAVLFLPALSKVASLSRRKHACLRCMIAALAVECYRQRHKSWPEAIDKLCPHYLAAVPLDPFDGQPLRYRLLDDGVVIYSVSTDGVDNGGTLDRQQPNRPGVDVGVRLWDVGKRRRPPAPKQPEDDPPR